MDKPFGLWIRETNFGDGRIFDNNLNCKTITELNSVISGPSHPHSEKQLGLRLDLKHFTVAYICPTVKCLSRNQQQFSQMESK